ncbi:MAG: hypothetical protein GWM90_24745 [Gemmatimonadetes bacterium]|nr:hypothetical protein [Gemmatimonadota bacterium]NIQ57988.1 hypothetical protein [Gemmatimonadota bacterium]NIU78169.1 hypothetical protein [Gammaproteobacteria bacterium]NIX47165.1 hypothetical protein [Gemmatimonadota bacterium]NIY11546.1 hypothetical protein [Gemmatimonadota bacterium]
MGILSALDAIASGRFEGYDPAVYQTLPENGRQPRDLLITNGTLAVPGLPTLQADVLVEYAEPLLRRGGVIADVGDLGGFEALDTLDIDGLFLVPMPGALDEAGALALDAPAHFIIAEDAAGTRVRYRFEGGPPPEEL